jgi:hypothetical protein
VFEKRKKDVDFHNCFRHCPLALQAPLVRSVVDEMLIFCRNDPEAATLRDDSGREFKILLL